MKRMIAAAVSVLLMAGCSSQPPSNPAQPTPSQSAVATSTAAATLPRFEDQEPGSGLAAGTYVLNYASIGGAKAYPTLAVTFTLPAGWDRVRVDGVVWNDAGTRLSFAVVDNLYTDPCDPDRGLREPSVGPSVDDLTRALATVPGWKITEVTEGHFHGFAGNSLLLTAPADFSSCKSGESRLVHTLGSPGYTPALSNGEHHALRILNVEGVRLVVDATSTTEASAQRLAELKAVVDSIEIQP